MSRIRTIKPEWLDDELSLECSDARVLAVAMILLADDHGLGRAHPHFLLSRVFPAKSSDVLARALEGLARIRYMVLYAVDGQKYYALRTWRKHQKVDHPSAPKVPIPTRKDAVIYATLSDFAKDSPDFARAVEKLAKGSESSYPNIDPSLSFFSDPEDQPDRSGSRARAKRWRVVPSSFEVTEAHRKLATELGVDLAAEEAKFRDHEFKDPKSDAGKTFSRWLRTAAEYGRGKSPAGKVGANADRLRARANRFEAEERAAQEARDAAK
jgi:hypothetical protein